MTPEDIDQILSSDDLLEPASGFVMSVMEAGPNRRAKLPRGHSRGFGLRWDSSAASSRLRPALSFC